MSAIEQQFGAERLLSRCQAGDQDAWHELVNRYRNLVQSVCLRLGVHETHCPDILQDTFLALHRSLQKISAAEALPSWLTTTATRLAYRHLAKRRQHLNLEDGDSVPAEDPSSRILDLQEQSEMRDALEKALQSLPADSVDLFKMLYIEDLSYAEISERTGRPAGSIGPTRMRGLAKLRQILQQEQYAWAS